MDALLQIDVTVMCLETGFAVEQHICPCAICDQARRAQVQDFASRWFAKLAAKRAVSDAAGAEKLAPSAPTDADESGVRARATARPPRAPRAMSGKARAA